jgi:hypothetical protein
MLQRRFSAAVLILLAIVWISSSASSQTASSKPLDLNSLSDSDLAKLTIRFERMPCYGSCPSYVVTIHGDGHVEYLGKKQVSLIGQAKGSIKVAAVRALLSEFSKTNFLSISEDISEANCKGRHCTDMATVVTELIVNGTSHKVTHYYGCGSAPRALFDLESNIDKSVNSEQWTGDVSKKGPFGTTCWGD